MRPFIFAAAAACLLLAAGPLRAQRASVTGARSQSGAPAAGATQTPADGVRRTLVMPFENTNRRIYWLSEASAILLSEDLGPTGANPVGRDERLHAFERLQLPATVALSEATVIKVGEVAGASDVIVGSLSLDGDTLTVRARDIRLDAGRFRGEATERGALSDLFAVFDRMAAQLTGREVPAAPAAAQTHPSLAAFESYVKGLLAETPAGQAKFLNAALAVYPAYDAARLALWQAYSAQADYGRALKAVLAVSAASPVSRRARFLASLSYIALKQYDEAFTTLKTLADAGPSPAIWNNLGIVQLRRAGPPPSGRGTYYFTQATEADKSDPDYAFNLGYAYWLERDPQAAIYWLREALRRNPADGDAHYVLGTVLLGTGAEAEGTREKELARQLSSKYHEWDRRPAADPLPRGLERLREDLDGRRLDRLETALTASGQKDSQELAAFHLDRGRRFFQQENDREAIAELRRALYLSPYQAEPHLLLGRLYLRAGRVHEAIYELKISLWSQETAAAHVALAEAYLQARNEPAARVEVERALVMDPASADAKKLLARFPPK